MKIRIHRAVYYWVHNPVLTSFEVCGGISNGKDDLDFDIK
jgi:hypothetical protein